MGEEFDEDKVVAYCNYAVEDLDVPLAVSMVLTVKVVSSCIFKPQTSCLKGFEM